MVRLFGRLPGKEEGREVCSALNFTSDSDNAVSLSQKHLPIKGLGVKIGRLASLLFLKGHEHENRKVQIDESAS